MTSTTTNNSQSLMRAETLEIPERIAEQTRIYDKLLSPLTQTLTSRPPRFVATCARGSSNNAAIYAKYLIETKLSLPVLSFAPSIASIYDAKLDLSDSLFLAISQSGQSADILSAAKLAKDCGAQVLALVNREDSALANLADWVLPMCAGPETSIAATKSYAASLSAIAHLTANWAGDAAMQKGIAKLPRRMDANMKTDYSTAVDLLKNTEQIFVIGRGPGFSAAQEAALKLQETCQIFAQSYTSSEVRHGPMTLIREGSVVMLMSVGDAGQPSVDACAKDFQERGAKIISFGKAYDGAINFAPSYRRGKAPLAQLMPITLIQSFYLMAETLSRAKGFDPDKPKYLKKETSTV